MWRVLECPSQSADLNPIDHAFTIERLKIITIERLEKYHNRRMQEFGDVSSLLALCSYCKKEICNRVLNVPLNALFTFIQYFKLFSDVYIEGMWLWSVWKMPSCDFTRLQPYDLDLEWQKAVFSFFGGLMNNLMSSSLICWFTARRCDGSHRSNTSK